MTRLREDSRTVSAEKRAERIPLGGASYKLSVLDPSGKLDGYHTHIFNDDGDRLLRAQRAGYQFVNKDHVVLGTDKDQNFDMNQMVSHPVGKHPNGQPMMAYLMAIPMEFYLEDQARKLKVVEEIDQAIQGGLIGQQGDDKRYIKSSNNIEINGRL